MEKPWFPSCPLVLIMHCAHNKEYQENFNIGRLKVMNLRVSMLPKLFPYVEDKGKLVGI